MNKDPILANRRHLLLELDEPERAAVRLQAAIKATAIFLEVLSLACFRSAVAPARLI